MSADLLSLVDWALKKSIIYLAADLIIENDSMLAGDEVAMPKLEQCNIHICTCKPKCKPNASMYMGHSPKLHTSVTSVTKKINKKWLTFPPTLLQQFLSKTNGLSKQTKQCNKFKCKEQRMNNDVSCKNSIIQLHKHISGRVWFTVFPLGHLRHMWLFCNTSHFYSTVFHSKGWTQGALQDQQ